MSTNESIESKEAVELLRKLIQIPSVNHGPNPSDEWEGALGEFLVNYLSDLGLQVEKQAVAPGRFNVIGLLEGQDPTRGLMLEAHMDTVEAANMVVPPFEGIIKENKIFGRGACDTKGSMAAMLMAMKELKQGGPPPINVYFVGTVDEEYSFKGIRELVKMNLPVEAAICGEPTELNLLNAHAGCVRWKVKTFGQQAHTSYPERGVNAIYAMADIVRLIEETDDKLKAHIHPTVGRPSICLSLIQGGEQVNTVPGFCEAHIDRRTIPGEDAMQVWREVNSTIEACMAKRSSEIKVDFEEPYLILHSLDSTKSDGFIDDFLAVCKAHTEGKAKFIAARYGTHASELAKYGIKSVVFGPGSIERAHGSEEYLEIDQLQKAITILVDTINNM